jgi:hypothetical protein
MMMNRFTRTELIGREIDNQWKAIE